MFPSLAAIRNAPDNGAAAAATTKLGDTLDQVAAYWNSKQSPLALGFAEAARDAARAIAAGNGDKAANLRKIEAQCMGCHMAHREDDVPDRVGSAREPDTPRRLPKRMDLKQGWRFWMRLNRASFLTISPTGQSVLTSCNG